MSWYSISPDEVGVTASQTDRSASDLPGQGAAMNAAALTAAGAAGSARVSGALDGFFSARSTVLPGLADYVEACTTAAREAASIYVEGDATMAQTTDAHAHDHGMQ